MVDAQALVQAEAQLAVIPPAERFFGLLEQAEGVRQADVEQALQGGPFLVRDQHLAGPGDGVVHVAVIGRDIVVAHHGELRVLLRLFGQPVVQGGQPAQLVFILVGVDALAVRHVGADDAHAIDGGGQDALLRIFIARVVLDHVRDRQFRQDGHAVVGFLAAEDDLVAGSLDLGDGKLVVCQFSLLQAEYVDRIIREPLQYLRQAHFQRVDVPGG